MRDEPKKSQHTWLRQAKADGWHMSEVTLPKRPDDRAWQKAVALRVVAIAAFIAMACVGLVDVKASPIVERVLFAVVLVVTLYAGRHPMR